MCLPFFSGVRIAGRNTLKHTHAHTHTNSPATHKVVVVISTASLCFPPKFLMSDYRDTSVFFFLFWRGGGISYDVRIFAACVEGTVWDVQFKGVVFLPFCFFRVSSCLYLYSHMHRSSTALETVYAQLRIFVVNFKDLFVKCALFSLPFLSTLNSSVELLKDPEFLFC